MVGDERPIEGNWRLAAPKPPSREFPTRLDLPSCAGDETREAYDALVILSRPGDSEGRRLARLEQELEDEQVFLIRDPDHLRGGFRNPEELRQLLLEELLYARSTPVHERRRNTYGSVLTAKSDGFESTISSHGYSFEAFTNGPDGPLLDFARSLADGAGTLLVRSPTQPLGVLNVPNGDELTLLTIAQELDSYALQRTLLGEVKVYTQDTILTYDMDFWSSKQIASSRAHEVGTLLALGDRSSPGVVMGLLDFCVHLLSPRHAGASLVWCLEDHF
jgi:hypothetical protein